VLDDRQPPFGRDNDPIDVERAVARSGALLLQQRECRGELTNQRFREPRSVRLVQDLRQTLAGRVVGNQG
jgi:hypothetical protein